MRPVTRTLPLAPSDSALLRTPENLRICRRCDQLIGLDVSDCPYCGLRQPALDGELVSRVGLQRSPPSRWRRARRWPAAAGTTTSTVTVPPPADQLDHDHAEHH